MDVFIARQPIFDNQQNVIAYELLYRKSEENFFDGSISSNVATSILLMNSFFSFGLDNLVGNEKAFINFDKHLIDADIPHLLNKNKVVIELLEDIIPDQAFVEKIRQLKSDGYTIALDDYVEGYAFDELTKIVDIIKVDFFENTKDQIRSIARKWKRMGKKLLAEKVETREVYEWAIGLGFDYYQGYFFSKPAVIKSKKIDDHAFQYIQLMEELGKTPVDNKAITKIVETDVTLTYKLLKLANSSYTDNRISSISHALAMLGSRAFERWLSLAMVQDLGASKPSAVVKSSMIRSAFMGNIADKTSFTKKQEEIRLIGVLSVIDVLLDKPMEEVMESLPLSADIGNTLLGQETQFSPFYQLVLAYEKGEFSALEALAKPINYDLKHMPDAYYQAIKWAEELFDYMNA